MFLMIIGAIVIYEYLVKVQKRMEYRDYHSKVENFRGFTNMKMGGTLCGSLLYLACNA